MTWRRYVALLSTAMALLVVPGIPARADEKATSNETVTCGSFSGNCKAEASSDDDDDEETTSGGGLLPRSASNRPSDIEIARKQAAEYRKAAKKFHAQLARYNDCLWTGSESCTAPDVLVSPGATAVITGGSGAPVITAGQAGAIAVARLQLPLNAPSVGPDPKLNKWKMAAVGYPLWVWAEGPAHVGPVSDSVGGLSVSLDARLTKTVFRMGDGESITCVGAGTPYKKGVRAGTPSPNCGYRYEKPSLPKGTNTVSAISYWAVTWTINGTSGVITVPRRASMPLPVGEVQVLIR
jgi:hypothetical protein